MRHGGTVQGSIREDAGSVGAKGGEKSPAERTAVYDFPGLPIVRSAFRLPFFIPLTIIPLTFLWSFPSAPVRKGRRLIRDILRYCELIRDNLTSRTTRAAAKSNSSYFHLIPVNSTWFHFPALGGGHAANAISPQLCGLSRSLAAILEHSPLSLQKVAGQTQSNPVKPLFFDPEKTLPHPISPIKANKPNQSACCHEPAIPTQSVNYDRLIGFFVPEL